MQRIGNAPTTTFLKPESRLTAREPVMHMTEQEARAAWEAENLGPKMTPAEAVASGAGLGPPSGSGRADNSPEKVHTEIKVNEKIVARVYNSGAMEIANDFRFLQDDLGDSFAADRIVGPDLAEARAKRVRDALEGYGIRDSATLGASALAEAKSARAPLLEMLRAATAQTQQQWLEMKSKEPPMPGSVLSMTA